MSDTFPLLSLFLSAFVSATLAPGGSEALLAWLVLQQTPEMAGPLWLSATVGNTLGAMTTWGLGRLLARGWSPQRLLARRVPATALERVRRFGLPVLLLAWLPLVGDGLCLAAGWLRLPWLPGLVLIAAGKGLRYGALVWWLA